MTTQDKLLLEVRREGVQKLRENDLQHLLEGVDEPIRAP